MYAGGGVQVGEHLNMVIVVAMYATDVLEDAVQLYKRVNSIPKMQVKRKFGGVAKVVVRECGRRVP